MAIDTGQPAGTATSAPTKTLRMAIAGLGIGGGMIVPAMASTPGIELVAAADVRETALEAFRAKFGGRTYTSVEALCSDPEVDAIWVATPNNLHCEHVVMVAEHGKHVVGEKPMALSIDEAERMVDAADRNHVFLLCGHTYSLNPSIQAMRRVVASGELGRLIAVNTWFETDWLLKPRMPEEIDLSLGGGVVYRHGPHLIDTIRLLGGGQVRSVRANWGAWMPERPAPGNFSAYLEFEDGTPATIAYNGYGYFDTSELTWGLGSRLYSDAERVAVRRQLRQGTFDVEKEKEAMRFTADSAAHQVGSPAPSHQRWFGLTVASCERGEVRQSPEGLFVYDDAGRREVPVANDRQSGDVELRELYDAVINGVPLSHDGRWGMATLEVCLAILQSGRERREIPLTHQCAVPTP